MQPIAATPLWTALTLAMLGAAALGLVSEGAARRVFLPGKTTVGHHQIELACGECHTSAFANKDEIQSACQRCHGGELDEAEDSHPRTKFTDPRNAARAEILDARYCVTCHAEHKEQQTTEMGVTVPEDYCFHCHQDIASERPSHTGMPFDSCNDTGCHNFHDNRALYEDYLVKHLDQPAQLAHQKIGELGGTATFTLGHAAAASAPALDETEQRVYETSAHGRANTNCSDCHSDGASETWLAAPNQESCRKCHSREVSGWEQGRHGMRSAAGLPPMRVGEGRIALSTERAHDTLTCNSCHAAHAMDTRHAAVQACQSCHVDEHTRSYADSKHAALWNDEMAGKIASGSGVSCATCHLPRTGDAAGGQAYVQHNQNDNLRPREKMVRGVCAQCHGVGFSLAALSNEELVRSNFVGTPTGELESMVLVRARARGEQ